VNNVLWYEFPVSSSKTCNLKGCPDLLFVTFAFIFQNQRPSPNGRSSLRSGQQYLKIMCRSGLLAEAMQKVWAYDAMVSYAKNAMLMA